MAIVRQIVELHDGTVSATSSSAEQGAVFTVNLPLLLVRQKPSSAARSSSDSNRHSQRLPELDGLRILLVADEPDARDLLNLVIESCGAQVKTVSSAAEASAIVKSERFDVLISTLGCRTKAVFRQSNESDSCPTSKAARFRQSL